MAKNIKTYPREWDKNVIQEILEDLDRYFVRKNERIEIVAIGGIAVVLQEFQNRSTNDIDVAPVSDAERFLKACGKLGIKAQFITVSSTVDFSEAPRIKIFSGRALVVFSVTAADLISLKLERFEKQDEGDIYSMIENQKVSYEKFVDIVRDHLPSFVGRKENYLVPAQIVVERKYSDKIEDFKERFK